MTKGTFGRRDILELMAAAGATGLPAVGTLWPSAAQAAGAPAYNPAARFDLAVSEVEFRRNSAGRMLMARIYQPKGPGPFPTVLDLHGGAWNRKDRLAEEPMDRALAASGLLVVAIDMTLAPEAPYPACVQDANYAVRWLKAKAATWNGDAVEDRHLRMLQRRPRRRAAGDAPARSALQCDSAGRSAERRRDRRLRRDALADQQHLRALQNAERRRNESMMKNNKVFFNPWETIHESNPQEILEREEKVTLVPFLIMQGALDDNVLPAVQEKFAKTYKAAGGDCDYRLFENCVHEWVAEPGPQTDKAREVVKEFIARQLKA